MAYWPNFEQVSIISFTAFMALKISKVKLLPEFVMYWGQHQITTLITTPTDSEEWLLDKDLTKLSQIQCFCDYQDI